MTLFSSNKVDPAKEPQEKPAPNEPATKTSATTGADNDQDQLKRLNSFVGEDTNTNYWFKGGDKGYVCRGEKKNGGRTCVNLALESSQMFKQFQNLGFYCALSQEVHSQDFECKRQ